MKKVRNGNISIEEKREILRAIIESANKLISVDEVEPSTLIIYDARFPISTSKLIDEVIETMENIDELKVKTVLNEIILSGRTKYRNLYIDNNIYSWLHNQGNKYYGITGLRFNELSKPEVIGFIKEYSNRLNSNLNSVNPYLDKQTIIDSIASGYELKEMSISKVLSMASKCKNDVNNTDKTNKALGKVADFPIIFNRVNGKLVLVIGIEVLALAMRLKNNRKISVYLPK